MRTKMFRPLFRKVQRPAMGRPFVSDAARLGAPCCAFRFTSGATAINPLAAPPAATIQEPTMTQTQMESLEVRIQLAVTAAFSPIANTLSVFGDSHDNQIVVSRNAAGQLL